MTLKEIQNIEIGDKIKKDNIIFIVKNIRYDIPTLCTYYEIENKNKNYTIKIEDVFKRFLHELEKLELINN